MRVSYRRQHPGKDGQVPAFLRSEFVSGTWERTGFDVDFPAIAKNPAVAAAVGYKGRNFVADAVDITRWYNRDTKVIAGSVIFSSGCEGPPGHVHGGAVSSALDDILGTMVWREAGFSRWGIPTMQLTVRFRGATPMERPLRFDTRVVKREGRKVFAEATLRDPACDGKLLAEADGLFYIRKQPSQLPLPLPQLGSSAVRTAAWAGAAPGAADPLSAPGYGHRAPSAERTKGPPPRTPTPSSPSTPTPMPTPTPSEGATGKQGSAARQPRHLPPSTPSTATGGLLSYDEAIREFGPGNSDAAANLVAFYGGDATALRQRRARL